MNSFDSSFVEDGKVNMTRISDYHDQVNPQLLTAYLTFSLAYSASNPLLFDKDVQVLVEPMILDLYSTLKKETTPDTYLTAFTAYSLFLLNHSSEYQDLCNHLRTRQEEDGSFPEASQTIMRSCEEES